MHATKFVKKSVKQNYLGHLEKKSSSVNDGNHHGKTMCMVGLFTVAKTASNLNAH